MDHDPIRVDRHASELGSWEVARGLAHPRLAALVLGYSGYREDTPGPLRRREVPSSRITLILSLHEPLQVAPANGPARTFTSFVAGLHDRPVFTEHAGVQHGVEVGLTPTGARALAGVPPGELANAVVHLDDLLGPLARQLAERLAQATGWGARFDIIGDVLAARAEAGQPPAPAVAHVWQRLAETGGRAPIRQLGEEVGWSRRHLAARFREQIGLPPKVMARVLRFERAHGLLMFPARPPLAQVAADCGYADQAHLNREFRALAGCTPTQLLQAALPDGGGTSGDVEALGSPSSKTALAVRA